MTIFLFFMAGLAFGFCIAGIGCAAHIADLKTEWLGAFAKLRATNNDLTADNANLLRQNHRLHRRVNELLMPFLTHEPTLDDLPEDIRRIVEG